MAIERSEANQKLVHAEATARWICLGWSAVILVLALSACGTEPVDSWRPSPGQPYNVVLITIDTLRAKHVGAYGYRRDTTPTLDRLSRSGATFNRVVAQSNWTVPATASILTSLMPSRHGAGVEGEIHHLSKGPLLQIVKGVPTIADLFEEAKYRTALFSANPYLFGRFKSGFEVDHVELRSATEIVDDTLQWIYQEDSDERPFFAYLQLMDLHQPIGPPEPFASMFLSASARAEEFSGWRFASAGLADRGEAFAQYRRGKIDLYDGALRFVDDQIARLLDGLREAGDLERTLIVVTSDHGEEFWEHVDQEIEMQGDPRGFYGIGHGHSMFRELLDAILIVWGPSVAPELETDCPVRQLEIAPTILDLVEIDVPSTFEGFSLAPLLRQGSETWPCPDSPILSESPAYGPDMGAVELAGLKLIWRADGRRLLFDSRTDPKEERDLSAERPDDVAILEAVLARAVAGRHARSSSMEGDSVERNSMELGPGVEAQLRELGYID